MTIKKYQGKTKEEAIDLAKAELGPRAVIMNVKEVHPSGFLGVFRKSTYEVTAAIEDEFAPAEREVFRGRDEVVDALRDAVLESSPKGADEGGKASEANPENTNDEKKEDKFVYEEIKPRSSFDAVAGDTLHTKTSSAGTYERTKKASRMPSEKPLERPLEKPVDTPSTSSPAGKKKEVSIGDLKSVFKEVNKVIETAPHLTLSEGAKNDRKSTVIKGDEVIGASLKSGSGTEKKTGERPSTAAPQSSPALERYAKEKPLPEKQFEKKFTSGDKPSGQKNAALIRMLYNMLMEQEVDERYVNRIIDEMGDVIFKENSLDYLLFNVYQKIVLLLGTPHTVKLSENRPHVAFFVGPTGVGKTTTIAKIASEFKVRKRQKVSLITADNYRIAAVRQLKVYADILKVPLSVVMTPEDVMPAIENYADSDLILVDTYGFSHRNDEQRENLKGLINAVAPEVSKQVFLVLSATTKYTDLKEIIDIYKGLTDFDLIFTKLDETRAYGNILNSKLYSGKSLSYVTTGQGVPDDIEEIDMQKLTMKLLKGDDDGSGRTT
ncbi:MAG: flagellar biosynthesis protein FlhF [Lachnospiraceae bacterium]|nr:flagellar biosynthesis protein FlhF [Lachnospiraceae bacterium]